MNQKTHELAIQAEIKFEADLHHLGIDTAVITRADLEKFAELIIKKCIQAASDPGDELIKGNTWHDGVRSSVWSIQDQFELDRGFGVE